MPKKLPHGVGAEGTLLTWYIHPNKDVSDIHVNRDK